MKAFLVLALTLLLAGCDKFTPSYTYISRVDWSIYQSKQVLSIVPAGNDDTLVIVFTDGTNIQISSTNPSSCSLTLEHSKLKK